MLTTFKELFDLYYSRHALVKLKCPKNTYYWGTKHGPYWFSRAVDQITKNDVQEWVDQVGQHSQSAATRAHNQLAAIFAWGLRRGYVTSNPCVGVEKFDDISRERFLNPAELARLKAVLTKQPLIIHDLIWVALLTGARKENLLSMAWSEIDLDLKVWRIPARKFKNGDLQVIPIDGLAHEILSRRKLNSKSPWVFPGRGSAHLKDPRAAWDRVRRLAQLDGFRFHDLRRTTGSYMAINGESLPVIGKALGHKDPRSTAIYARLDLDAIRKAFTAMHSSLTSDRQAS